MKTGPPFHFRNNIINEPKPRVSFQFRQHRFHIHLHVAIKISLMNHLCITQALIKAKSQLLIEFGRMNVTANNGQKGNKQRIAILCNTSS